MTRRTRGPLPSPRAVGSLAFAASLVVTAPSPATATTVTAIATGTTTTTIPATAGDSRTVVRIGAVLFALGSIATFVAAGSRRPPPREVDADGRDL